MLGLIVRREHNHAVRLSREQVCFNAYSGYVLSNFWNGQLPNPVDAALLRFHRWELHRCHARGWRPSFFQPAENDKNCSRVAVDERFN